MRAMVRRAKDSASGTVTIRMTREDRTLLDRLVANRARELADEGLTVTPAALVRGLIRREARAQGLLPTVSVPRERDEAEDTVVEDTDVQLAIPGTEAAPDGYAEQFMAFAPCIPPAPPTPRVEAPPAMDHAGDEPTMLCEPENLTQRRGEPRVAVHDETLMSAEDVRERALRAIRGRRYRQRDLVEASGVSQAAVSRFLLGADTSERKLEALRAAVEKLDN